jgi:hypothetical protein
MNRLLILGLAILSAIAFADTKSPGPGSFANLTSIPSGTLLGTSSGGMAAPSALSTLPTGFSTVLSLASGTAPTNGMYLSSANQSFNTAAAPVMTAKDGTAVLQFLSSSETGQSPTDTLCLGYGTCAALTESSTPGPNVAIGQYALGSVTTGDHNVAIGPQAQHFSTTGTHNTSVGIDNLSTATAPSNIVTMGEHALTFATTATNGTFVGISAGFNLGSTNFDTAFGFQALQGVTSSAQSSSSQTAIGAKALTAWNGGTGANTAVGSSSLSALSTGANNTALGTNSGASVTTGSGNVLIGPTDAGLTTGSSNFLVGSTAVSGSTGSATCMGAGTKCGGNDVVYGYLAHASVNGDNKNNTAIGNFALHGDTSGNHNVALGFTACQPLTTGGNNMCLGYGVASTTLTTGSSNILIGTSSAVDTLTSSTSNEINVGGLLFYNNASTAAPAVSACGTSPAIDAHANNRSGTVTTGSGVNTSCTVTLAGSGYTTWNHCRVTPHQSDAGFAYSYTTTVITVTATSLTSEVFDYDCDGY